MEGNGYRSLLGEAGESPPGLPLLPTRQEGTSEMEGNGYRSLLGEAGESPPGLPHLPGCPYTTGMGLWDLRTRSVKIRL